MPRTIVTATIPAGQSLSDAVDLSAGIANFLLMPSGWTPAKLSFQVSADNINFSDLVDMQAKEIIIKPFAGTGIKPTWIPPTVGWLRFRSGTRHAPTIQTADRIFTMAIDT